MIKHNIFLAAPSAPTITSLISTYSDQLTVTWTSVPTATSYNVSINDSVNTLVPIPSTGAPQYKFTGLTNNTVYTVSVVAINCAGSSSPATMSNRTSKCASIPLIATLHYIDWYILCCNGLRAKVSKNTQFNKPSFQSKHRPDAQLLLYLSVVFA